MFKLTVFSAILAFTSANFLANQRPVEVSSPSISPQSSSFLRSPSGLAQVAAYSKSIETPYSGHSKSDVHAGNGSPISYSQGISASGYNGHASGDSPAFPSGPGSVAHVTYGTGPVAFAASPSLNHRVSGYRGSSFADHAIGTSRESTVQSDDGSHAVTHYTKAVDTAYSSVRKSENQNANDAKVIASAPSLTYTTAAAAFTTPIVTKDAYIGHANPAVAYSSRAPAPAVAHASFEGLGTRYSW